MTPSFLLVSLGPLSRFSPTIVTTSVLGLTFRRTFTFFSSPFGPQALLTCPRPPSLLSHGPTRPTAVLLRAPPQFPTAVSLTSLIPLTF